MSVLNFMKLLKAETVPFNASSVVNILNNFHKLCLVTQYRQSSIVQKELIYCTYVMGVILK